MGCLLPYRLAVYLSFYALLCSIFHCYYLYTLQVSLLLNRRMLSYLIHLILSLSLCQCLFFMRRDTNPKLNTFTTVGQPRSCL